MGKNRWAVRSAPAAFGVLVLAGILGPGCTSEPPESIIVELVNTTDTPVNPGLIVDGVLQIVDPPLAAGELLPLEVDCFAGLRLQTQADLLTGVGTVPSDNDPYVDEGFEFLCGDTLSFVFKEDDAGFFTDVEVNGVTIDAPTP